MKEILQSIIPVITAFLGAFLTYLAQSKLINKQLTLNKEQIKFTKSRDSLGKLKSLHLSIMFILTDLDIDTRSFKKKWNRPENIWIKMQLCKRHFNRYNFWSI